MCCKTEHKDHDWTTNAKIKKERIDERIYIAIDIRRNMLPALEAYTSVNTNSHLPSLEDYEAEENRRKDIQSLHKMANFFEKKVKTGEII